MPKSLDTNALTVKGRTRYQILRRTPKAPYTVEAGGKTFDLSPKNGSATFNDKGIADELFAKYHKGVGNGDFLIAPVEKPIDPGYKRTFLVKLPYEKKFTGDKEL